MTSTAIVNSFCTTWSQNQQIIYWEWVDWEWVDFRYIWEFYLSFYEALYDFLISVFRMLGYRKLGVGWMVSREQKCNKGGKHLSARGSDVMKDQDLESSLQVSDAGQPTAGEPALDLIEPLEGEADWQL